MDALVTTYLIYLTLSIVLTVWVARTLSRNGILFLVDVFRGNTALATSVNHLLVVGFYLINFGFISLFLKLGYEVTGARGSIEALASKVGVVLLVLGGMHFFNMYVFTRMRQHAMISPSLPPVDPDSCTRLPESMPEAGEYGAVATHEELGRAS